MPPQALAEPHVANRVLLVDAPASGSAIDVIAARQPTNTKGSLRRIASPSLFLALLHEVPVPASPDVSKGNDLG
jgi:hypothetical protein